MPGPCPQGAPTMVLHKEARCRDKERCTGQGCRVRRIERHDPILTGLRADRAAERRAVLVADLQAAGIMPPAA